MINIYYLVTAFLTSGHLQQIPEYLGNVAVKAFGLPDVAAALKS
jgi:hypothetical protein